MPISRSTALESSPADNSDPGAVDNRLSLDPNNVDWADAIADWEDGSEYTLTVKVTQISPGEFEVNEVTPKAEEEDDATEEQEEPMMKGKTSGKVNKAVRNMMRESM
jgi:hypothetical protein